MCLDFLSEFEIKSDEGYKMFLNRKRKLYGVFWAGNTEKEYPTNIWLKEKDYRNPCFWKLKSTNEKEIEISPFTKYKPGFHIFINKNDAEKFFESQIPCRSNYFIKKVKFRNIVAKGIQESLFQTVVAKEMMVLDDEI